MSWMTRAGASCAALLLVVAVGCGSSSSSGKSGTNSSAASLTVAYSVEDPPQSQGQYFAQLGLYEKHNVNVKLQYVRGKGSLDAVVGGSVDIALTGTGQYLAAKEQDLDVIAIAGVDNHMPYQLIAKKDVASLSDLAGTKLGVNQLGTTSEYAARLLFANANVPTSNIKFITVGDVPTRLAALKGGSIASTLVNPPTTYTAEASTDIHVLAETSGITYQHAVMVVKPETLKSKAAAIRDFLAAWAEGTAAMYAQRDQASTFFQDKYHLTPDVARKTVDYYVEHVYPSPQTGPYPDMAGIKEVMDTSGGPKVKAMTPEQVVDLSALDQLKQKDYFGKLAEQYHLTSDGGTGG